MERKRSFNIFNVARECGAYDEWPSLPEGVFDIQLHMSRNDRPQPFFLVCDHDTVLVQMSGAGRVELKEASVVYHTLEPGDYIYVPAGTPHRVVPETESVQVRYKAASPELEGVAWYCEGCGGLLWRQDWELASELPQEGYLRVCKEFNANATRRTCARCGWQHPAVDLDGLRWEEIGQALHETEPIG
jgi:3-hydroxyanthranilate 3,4-dioxygenase